MQKRMNKPRRVIHSVDELPVLCNCAEAGLLLRLNPEVVARMARDGVLKGAKQGQSWFFRRDDLVEYMNTLFDGAVTDGVIIA
ncbi:MAG: helix-turn-helix domain-containing protein [Oscillospiraceae bacterium]|nr:helix-turn-helix domain-containing protein [Oscillospiraceae bacterium]